MVSDRKVQKVQNREGDMPIELAEITEVYLCPKCHADFTESEGVLSQAGAKSRLSCPVCGAFRKFVPKEMPDPGLELVYARGSHFRKTIEDVYGVDPSYVRYMSGLTGRGANAARLFLAQVEQRVERRAG